MYLLITAEGLFFKEGLLLSKVYTGAFVDEIAGCYFIEIPRVFGDLNGWTLDDNLLGYCFILLTESRFVDYWVLIYWIELLEC